MPCVRRGSAVDAAHSSPGARAAPNRSRDSAAACSLPIVLSVCGIYLFSLVRTTLHLTGVL
jgi:hypothetical protein